MRTHLIDAVKAAAGATLAILLANLLGLQFSATAGIITMLSLMGTKRETLRVAGGRTAAFLVSLGIAWVCYSVLGYNLAGFGTYLFLFSVACYALGWHYAVTMMAVLMSHFLGAETLTFTMVLNEAGVFFIGIGCGVLVNLSLRANGKRAHGLIKEADESMRSTLRALADGDAAAARDNLALLKKALTNASDFALRNAGNTLLHTSDYDLRYIAMRSNQCRILEQVAEALGKVPGRPQQYQMVQAYLDRIAREYREENSVAELLAAHEELLRTMQRADLPVTREEFESRALLFYILCRMADFLGVKRHFYLENGGQA